jgi:hypothetical protein
VPTRALERVPVSLRAAPSPAAHGRCPPVKCLPNVEPRFDSVRSDPRYAALVHRLMQAGKLTPVIDSASVSEESAQSAATEHGAGL